jgi:hypothetical protein
VSPERLGGAGGRAVGEDWWACRPLDEVPTRRLFGAHPLTPGSLFGLLGAIVAFGQKRGGTYGTMILRQYGQWALILFIFGFFMPGVNNVAHAGGFLGGFAMGFALSLAERRAERGVDYLLAAGCIGVTLLGFALNIWSTLIG